MRNPDRDSMLIAAGATCGFNVSNFPTPKGVEFDFHNIQPLSGLEAFIRFSFHRLHLWLFTLNHFVVLIQGLIFGSQAHSHGSPVRNKRLLVHHLPKGDLSLWLTFLI